MIKQLPASALTLVFLGIVSDLCHMYNANDQPYIKLTFDLWAPLRWFGSGYVPVSLSLISVHTASSDNMPDLQPFMGLGYGKMGFDLERLATKQGHDATGDMMPLAWLLLGHKVFAYLSDVDLFDTPAFISTFQKLEGVKFQLQSMQDVFGHVHPTVCSGRFVVCQ